MGLDLLDISYRIEETFDVSLSGDDLTELAREGDIAVGDLYELVLRKMHLRDVARYDVGLNYALWRELQAVIHCVAEVPPDRIELKTPLEDLFPRETRRTKWEDLRNACPYRVPKLDYPRVVRVVGFSLATAVVLAEQFQIWQIPALRWFWPLLGLLGIWMLLETYLKVLWILAPLRSHLPAGMNTVKDLCRTVLARDYERICHDVEIPLDERCLVVWQKLTDLLVDVLGVDPDTITFRSRLFRDLGME